MEIIDQYCRILLMARELGEARRLTREQMKHIYSIKQKIGATDDKLPCDNCNICDDVKPPEEKPKPDQQEPQDAQAKKVDVKSATLVPDPQVIEKIVRDVFNNLR
jgi:hypothetical protein